MQIMTLKQWHSNDRKSKINTRDGRFVTAMCFVMAPRLVASRVETMQCNVDKSQTWLLERAHT